MWQTSQDFRFNTRLMRVDVEKERTVIWEYGGVTWHEYRGPRNPLILQDVSASFGGLGAIQRLGPTSRVCAQNGQRTKRAILVTHNSDDGRYSNSEICRTSDLRRRPCSLRGHIFADTHALDHPHTTASASPTDRDAAAIKPKSVRHADPA
jgi:hypothetical protein